MQTVQQASPNFFIPVATVYLLLCAVQLAVCQRRPQLWSPKKTLHTDRQWLDLVLVLCAGAAILLLGQAYRSNLLFPRGETGTAGLVYWSLNQVIIYGPILAVLFYRRQGPLTVFLSPVGLHKKLLWGIGLGLGGVVLFLAMRNELGRFGAVLAYALSVHNLAYYALPVFLEGVAVAFGFVRIRWALGLPAALVLPAVLFALAHVPGSIEGGSTWSEIAAFFVFNTGLVTALLYFIQRSQDVIWIWVIHYLMDAAIKAY